MSRKVPVLLCGIIICALPLANLYAESTLDSYLSTGTRSLEAGQLDTAILNFSKAVELDNKSAAAYNGLASAYQRLDKIEVAINKFTKAIELNPSYKEAYFGRGICYLRASEYDKGIADLGQLIKLDKNNADAYYYRAQAYLTKGDYAKSMEDIQMAEKLGKVVDREILESVKTGLKMEEK